MSAGSATRKKPPRRRRSSATQAARIVPADYPLPRAPETGPQRRCIVTGEIRDRAQLLRFVVGPDGTVVPDVDARLPGRGLWLLPRRDIVERAVAKRVFARAARRPVVVPPELADRCEALLARRCGEVLGLARRAGAAVAGYERVGEAVRRGDAALLLFARDGAAAGRRRMASGRRVASATVLDAAELSGVFGRERVVFAAVGRGSLSSRLLVELMRLAGFRAAAAVEGIDSAAAGPSHQDDGTGTHE
ncbi:MAG TPA: RNA-binding protein [Stellaceae bacterium]|nr:RNA-binding protein [Stellaceae bacterium]